MKISKREASRLARRSQIIAVAREHFFENGFEGTVMSAIAAQLGGSKRTLWSYFPSKEDLFIAVVEDTAGSVRAGIDFSGAGDSPLEKLTILARTVIERFTAPISVQMFRLISPLSDRYPDLVKAFYERGPERTRQRVADCLRDNFAEILWTEDYMDAGNVLVAIAASEFHFESLWGMSPPPTAKQKDARAHHAAMLFLRTYAREPDRWAPVATMEQEELVATAK